MWHRQAKIPNAAEELESLAWINLEYINSWLKNLGTFYLSKFKHALNYSSGRVSNVINLLLQKTIKSQEKNACWFCHNLKCITMEN